MKRQRIAMAVEFDGAAFHGWQQQDNAISVQSTIECALSDMEGETVQTVAAGRTDSGVHAEAMLIHTDVSFERWHRSNLAYIHGVNSKLPESVRVAGVRAVHEAFHARFDCRERTYRYQIWNRNTPSAIQRWQHWWMPRPLDLSLMQAAARYCLGKQDFSSLRASGCQASHAVRTINRLDLRREGVVIEIEVAADAFLYHMVRNLVGNLVEVGLGKRSPEEMKALLEMRDRSKGGATAPAHGLYFVDAQYDDFSARELLDSH